MPKLHFMLGISLLTAKADISEKISELALHLKSWTCFFSEGRNDAGD